MTVDNSPEASSSHGTPKKVTEEMLETLPSAVKNWLLSVGVAGREPIRNVTLKQSGTMKLKPEQKEWTASESEQISFTEPPGFRWEVKMKMGRGMFVTGKDSFEDGKGSMRIKLAGFLPVSKTLENDKTNQSSMQRFLMEMGWYPTAALNSYIHWKEVDAYTTTATMEYRGLTGSAVFFFNEQYELVKVEAWRYKDSEEDARPLLCTGTIKAHKVVDGLKVPVEIDISWLLDEGPFTWYRFRASDIRFNSHSQRF